jgi:hypothetical protein
MRAQVAGSMILPVWPMDVRDQKSPPAYFPRIYAGNRVYVTLRFAFGPRSEAIALPCEAELLFRSTTGKPCPRMGDLVWK